MLLVPAAGPPPRGDCRAARPAGPGEAAEVRLRIPARAFARYDEHADASQNADTDAGTGTGGWVWPRGEYTVEVGRSSRDLPLSVPVTRI